MNGCMDRSGWNPAMSGFSHVQEMSFEGNPFGADKNFTVVYAGFFEVTGNHEGDWKFSLNTDSAAELLGDGRLMSGWYGSHTDGDQYDDHAGSLKLTAGWHYILFRYINVSGSPFAQVVFSRPGDSGWTPVSTDELTLKSFPLDEGLQLVTAAKGGTLSPDDSDAQYHNVEIAAHNDAEHSGWSVVTAVDQHGNPHGADSGYVSRYQGWFEVGADQGGLWTFAVNSSNAAEIEVDDEIVAAWYGEHNATNDNDYTHAGQDVSLQPGWHRLIIRYEAGSSPDPRLLASFRAPGADWQTIGKSHLTLLTLAQDDDLDGLHNDLEAILGTNRGEADTDGDRLADLFEATIGSNPLNPDTNGDGLGDGFELDTGDGYENITNPDNDDDGVIDGKDLSPATHTAVQKEFHLEVTTSGKKTHLDFQLRPENPMHLMMINKQWDWPDDTTGQMQELDNQNGNQYDPADVTLIPMLELRTTMAPAQDDVKDFGISVADDPRLGSFHAHAYHYDGFAVGDVLGNGADQAVIARQKTHKITIRDKHGHQLAQFSSAFTSGDKLLVGNVIGDHKDEIIVLHNNDDPSKDDMAYIYNGDGSLLLQGAIVLSEDSKVAVGNYNIYTDHEDILVADPELGKLMVSRISPDDHDGYLFQLFFSPEGYFTPDDGFAVGDIDGDGRDEVLVAGNVDNVLQIYRHEEGNAFTRTHVLNNFDFDPSDTLGAHDILPEKEPGDGRSGDEIIVFKESGKMQVYTEKSSQDVDENENIDYSVFDRVDFSNMAGSDQTIVVNSDTSGVVNIYNPQYKKAYVPLAPVYDDQGRIVAFQGRMIYSATGDQPVTLTADVRLVWSVVGKSDRAGKSPETRVLAQYEDPFLLTGFLASEERGIDVAVGYKPDGTDRINRVALAHSAMLETFVYGSHNLAEALGNLDNISEIGVPTARRSFDGELDASQWLDEQLEDLITGTNGLPDGIYPILLMSEKTNASVSLMDMVGSGETAIDSLKINLQEVESITTRSIKMNWYDTTEGVVRPMTFAALANEVDKWSLNDDEKVRALSTIAIGSMDSSMDFPSVLSGCATAYEPERYTVFDIAKKGWGMGKTVIFNVNSAIKSVRQGRQMMIEYNQAAHWRLAKGRAVPIYKMKEWVRLSKTEIQNSGIGGKLIRTGNKLTKGLHLPFKGGKFLTKWGGSIAAVGMSVYTFYAIGSQTGWSNSGTALASVYFGYYLVYGLALEAMIAAGPVGIVVAAIVVASDVIYGFCHDGNGWSDEMIQWVAEKITHTLEVRPDLEITDTRVTISDYDQNGLTVGDRIEVRFRATETIQKSDKEVEGYDEDDTYKDMLDSFLVPRATITESSTCRSDSSRYLVHESINSKSKQRVWDFGVWVEPTVPAVDFKLGLILKAHLKAYYGLCTGNKCDREYSDKTTSSEDVITSHFDVLPATLDAFLSWSELHPMDLDNDGLQDSFEDLDDGPWYLLSGKNHDGQIAMVDAHWHENQDWPYFYFGDYRSDEYAPDSEGVPEFYKYHWRLEPADNGTIKLVNRYWEAKGDPAFMGIYQNRGAYAQSSAGDDILWSLEPIVDDWMGLFNLGLSQGNNGVPMALAVPNSDPASSLNACPVVDIGNTNYSLLWRLEPLGAPTSSQKWDTDGDGLSDYFEIKAWTQGLYLDPENADTDGDGLSDREELKYGTSPLHADTDKDGLSDREEVEGWKVTWRYNTQVVSAWVHPDPLRTDTDGDGLSDLAERDAALNPLSMDTDGDRISDLVDNDALNPPPGSTDDDFDRLSNETEEAGFSLTIVKADSVNSVAVTSDPQKSDTDGDGLDDYEEYLIANPRSADTDDDGLTDYEEIVLGTNPLHFDTDGDGLTDGEEKTRGTDPRNPDTDDDGLTDHEELGLGTNPLVADTDGDGLTDADEVNLYHTPPQVADADGDGLSDGDEINLYHTPPLVADADGDGLSDGDEINAYATNPQATDSDGDLINDYQEIKTYHTNPNRIDTDDDALTDYEEVHTYGTDPNAEDSDTGDLLLDGEEIALGTNPLSGDSDGDHLNDGDEIRKYKTNPMAADTDGDGLSDHEEIWRWATNPNLADTDGDGIPDTYDPDTFIRPALPASLANMNIGVLVTYDGELTEEEQVFVDQLSAMLKVWFDLASIPPEHLRVDSITAVQNDPDANLGDYPFILLLGEPDTEASEETAAYIMAHLMSPLSYQLMRLGESQGVEGDELRHAFLTSIHNRFAVAALPQFIHLPSSGLWADLPRPNGSQLQQDLGIENSLVVMLSRPMKGDEYQVIKYFKLLQKYFWLNTSYDEWHPDLTPTSECKVPFKHRDRGRDGGNACRAIDRRSCRCRRLCGSAAKRTLSGSSRPAGTRSRHPVAAGKRPAARRNRY